MAGPRRLPLVLAGLALLGIVLLIAGITLALRELPSRPARPISW